jgi:hypothetical protein
MSLEQGTQKQQISQLWLFRAHQHLLDLLSSYYLYVSAKNLLIYLQQVMLLLML